MTNASTLLDTQSDLPLVIPWVERAIEGGILILILIVALFGNISLWIVILRSRDLRNESNYLVLCLSFADILVSGVNMPVTIFTIFNGDWYFSALTCTVTGFTNMITFVGSVMSLGIISFNRYIKICQSHRYRTVYTPRNIVFMVGGVWCFSGLLALPPLIGWGTYNYIPTQSFCFCDWPTSVSYTFFMVGVCFGGPCSVMTFCYIKILRIFRASKSRISSSSQPPSAPSSKPPSIKKPKKDKTSTLLDKPAVQNTIFLTVPEDESSKVRTKIATLRSQKAARRRQEEFRLAMSLLVVIFVFVACWLPFCVTMFLSVFLPSSVKRGSDMFTILLGYANSGCNPIIYGFMNNRFKMAYKKLFYDVISPCKNVPQERKELESSPYPSGSEVPDANSSQA
ncbi:melatonin receptor type 1B-A-like [Haliotis cracherodii]|uniref:melatonin receptor type 1B-A-like n=1 Tax=Haliotis cracherodii TaxID=6455 RepID=UPI0039EAF52B